MQKNESVLDRIVRLVLAGVFAYMAAYVFAGTLSVVLYVLAAVMLITSITGFCLIYKLLGISTNK